MAISNFKFQGSVPVEKSTCFFSTLAKQNFPTPISSHLMRYLIFQAWVSCPSVELGVERTTIKVNRWKREWVPWHCHQKKTKWVLWVGWRRANVYNCYILKCPSFSNTLHNSPHPFQLSGTVVIGICNKRIHIAPKYPVPEPRLYVYFRLIFWESEELAFYGANAPCQGIPFCYNSSFSQQPFEAGTFWLFR